MPRWTGSDKARIEYRRTLVQRMSVRGMKLYEITKQLDEQGVTNPDTGGPYDAATISRDLSEIEARLIEESMQELRTYKAKQLAELREARMAAWQNRDYREVRQNLETEMKLLGTPEPLKTQISTGDEPWHIVMSWNAGAIDDDAE